MTSALAAALALLAACSSDPTQLVVIVESDYDTPDELARIELIVDGPTDEPESFEETIDDAGALPLTFGVVPAGNALGPVVITAIGYDPTGTELVRTGASVRLVEGESRVLVLYLIEVCRTRGCSEGQACRPDGCGALEVPRSELALWEDSTNRCRYDRDADGDGSIDSACDGADCDWTRAEVHPDFVESCDGIDNNCDGTVDEGCGCAPVGMTEACTTPCGSASTRTCQAPGTWGPCTPPAETCNGVDDDCNGVADEGFPTEVLFTGSFGNGHDGWSTHTGSGWSVVYVSGGAVADNVSFVTVGPSGAVSMPIEVVNEGGEPRIAWHGSGYGFAYYERNTYSCGCSPTTGACSTCSDYPLFFTPLDTAGMVTGPGPDELDADAGANPRARLGWTGSELILTWDEPTRVARFSPDGSMIDTTQVAAADTGLSDLAILGSSYALAWGNNGVWLATGSGAVLGMGMPILPSDAGLDPQAAWIGSNGSGYALVAYDWDSEQLVYFVADAAGNRTSDPQALAPATAMLDRAVTVVASAAGQAVAVWTQRTIIGESQWQLARISPDGTLVEGPTTLALPGAQVDDPSLTWSAGRGLLVYDDENVEEALWAILGCR